MKAKALCILLMLILAACGGAGQPVAVTHIASLTYSGIAFTGETTQVISDQASWQNLWSRMYALSSSPPPLPAVDFNTNVLLVASAGVLPTGGFSVAITGATKSSGGDVTVNVVITKPGSNCPVTEALTSPVDIATMPIPTGNVQFVIKHQTHGC